MTKVLLAVHSAAFPGALLDEVYSRHAATASDVTIAMSLQEISKAQLAAASFDAVVSVSASAQSHSAQAVAQLLLLAKPGASITLQEPVSSSAAEGVSSPEKLQQQALLGGLTQGATAKPYGLPLSPALAGRDGVQSGAVEGRKPTWEAGAQQSIKRKLGGKAAGAMAATVSAVSAPAAAASPATVWSAISADDAELLDDEDLLTEEDLVRPAAPAADDCSVSRKACKNCTCGRAEEEAAGAPPPQLTKDMLENPGAAGGCGSCALGDAFRCGSCPYRGLPSFQPGKKIELPTGFLAADL